MDGVLDALVTAAPADVARHRLAYLVVRRFRIFVQERSGLHDLAGLAEAALRHVDLAPGLLHRMIAGRVQALDGRDRPSGHVGNRGDAGADSLLVDHHSAGTAQRLAATVLGARQSHLVTEKPE